MDMGLSQRKTPNGHMLLVLDRDLIVAGTEVAWRFPSNTSARLACASWDGLGVPPNATATSPRCACCGRIMHSEH